MELQELLQQLKDLGASLQEVDPTQVRVGDPDPEIPELPDLYQIFADYFVSEEKEQAPRIRPSGLGVTLEGSDSPCALAWWGQMQGLPTRPVKAGEAMMFDHGNRIHERMGQILQEVLPQYGWYVVAIEKRVSFDDIWGSLDVLIEHARTGYRLVIDFKTKRGNAFRYLDEAKADNVLQLQFYIAATESDGGILVYLDREGQNFMSTFFVEPDVQAVERAISIARLMLDPNDKQGPPPLGLTVVRKENKGPDSIYLKRPWQMDWCKLEECLCAQACAGGNPPDGIVAKIDNDGLVTMTEGNEQWADTVLPLLRASYPDEEFHVEGDLFD